MGERAHVVMVSTNLSWHIPRLATPAWAMEGAFIGQADCTDDCGPPAVCGG